MKDFRTYQLAKKLFHAISNTSWISAELKDQANRAALSIVLNIAEGYGKRTANDRRRFYHHAMGSLREVQACLDISAKDDMLPVADQLGACLYRLIHNPGQFQ